MLIFRNNKNKINKKFQLRKSQVLLFGSLLIFIGIVSLSWNYLLSIREELYSDMMLSFSDKEKKTEEAPITDNVKKEETVEDNTVYDQGQINYDRYLGVLYIPKIGLRRGFFNTDSRYNDIQYNLPHEEELKYVFNSLCEGNLMNQMNRNNYLSHFLNLYTFLIS